MKDIDGLIEIIDRLLAPDGCPWDREQTLVSMRSSLLEETSETIEAINLDQNEKIKEELGDLFFNVIFLCRLAEKEKRFNIEDIVKEISNKLIRRHPHIFGDAVAETSEEVLKQWSQIKQLEKGTTSSSLLSNIPKELPSLMRAQKIIKRLQKAGYPLPDAQSESKVPHTEEQLGEYLFRLLEIVQDQGLDAEQALRKYLAKLEVVVKQTE